MKSDKTSTHLLPGRADLEAMSAFRYELRRFLRASEQVANAAGITTLQYQLLLHVCGFTDRQWATVGVGVMSGVAGGVFCWLLLNTARWMPVRLFALRKDRPVAYGAVCGLFIAIIGVASGGHLFGSGYSEARAMLEGQSHLGAAYPLLKMISMIGSYLPGTPGGLFAPSLAIGAGIGNALHMVFGQMQLQTHCAWHGWLSRRRDAKPDHGVRYRYRNDRRARARHFTDGDGAHIESGFEGLYGAALRGVGATVSQARLISAAVVARTTRQGGRQPHAESVGFLWRTFQWKRKLR